MKLVEFLIVNALTVGTLWVSPDSGQQQKGQEDKQAENLALEEERRLKAFQEELQKAENKVDIAIKMVKDEYASFPHPMKKDIVWAGRIAKSGMDVLLEHWEDPRSETVLEDLSKRGQLSVRDGFLTLAGEAKQRLWKVQAKKVHKSLMEGKTTPRESYDAVKKYLEEHPEVYVIGKRPSEMVYLSELLIGEAIRSGGADAIPFLVRAGFQGGKDTGEYCKTYFRDLLVYARKIGPAEALSTDLIGVLVRTQDKAVTALLEEWLKDAKEEWVSEALVNALGNLPGAQDRMIKLLEDNRLSVVRRAIGGLGYLFPDQKSIDAIRKTVERLMKSGMTTKDASYYNAVIKGIEEELRKRRPK